ncbi:MAG: DNA alkylation repair protein [Flavobacterium sp.]|nr:MAG: DNA alkylation repair protein [Flavobacterium sp.]
METSQKAKQITAEITKAKTQFGDLRKVAKEVKKDHSLGLELWSTGNFMPMLLATLIFDPKSLSEEILDNIFLDIEKHTGDERLLITDWLMANQLMKDKKLTSMIVSWQNNSSPLKRRIFWYHQARLRWTGQTPPDNTEELLVSIENEMKNEDPEVQWAMNFTAGWIGIFDPAFRARCIIIGETHGMYKDEIVHKNCTPSYLPEFINSVVTKRKLR